MSTFDELKAAFILITKRIIKEKLTTNIGKHKEYIRDLVPAYNKIIEFISYKEKSGITPEAQNVYKAELIKLRERFGECLRRLNINIELNTQLLVIYRVDPLIKLLDEWFENNTAALQASNYFTDSYDELEGAVGGQTSSKIPNINKETGTTSESANQNNLNMARDLTVPEFMRLCAQTINYNYEGNPLTLDSFISSIEYLQIVTTDPLKETLFRFVGTKLAGKAKEAVPRDAQNVEAIIINALKSQIKPDSSKVVAGRMIALRLDKKQIQEFSKTAE